MATAKEDAGGRQVCTFYLEGLFFGMDVNDVQEVIRLRDQPMTLVPLAPRVVSGLINLRGQIVTAIDLRRRLRLNDRPPEAHPMNIVVRTEDDAVSLLVDRIGDVISVDEELFEAPPETMHEEIRKLLVGVCKLEGRLLLILNTKRVVNLEDGSLSTPAHK